MAAMDQLMDQFCLALTRTTHLSESSVAQPISAFIKNRQNSKSQFTQYATIITNRPPCGTTIISFHNNLSPWGTWGSWVHCPESLYVVGVVLKSLDTMEPDQLEGAVDIRLMCARHLEVDKANVVQVETSNVPANAGTWNKIRWCNSEKLSVALGIWSRDPKSKIGDYVMEKFSRREEKLTKSSKIAGEMDYGELDNLYLYCSNENLLKLESIPPDGLQLETQFTFLNRCPPFHAICGVRTKFYKSSAKKILDSSSKTTFVEDISGISDYDFECCPIPIQSPCEPKTSWKKVAPLPYCINIGGQNVGSYEDPYSEKAMAHNIGDDERVKWFAQKLGGPWEKYNSWDKSGSHIYKKMKDIDHLEQLYGKCGIYEFYTPVVRKVLKNGEKEDVHSKFVKSRQSCD